MFDVHNIDTFAKKFKKMGYYFACRKSQKSVEYDRAKILKGANNYLAFDKFENFADNF
jgi:hypothetical protein